MAAICLVLNLPMKDGYLVLKNKRSSLKGMCCRLQIITLLLKFEYILNSSWSNNSIMCNQGP